jgi:hypothetical protein
MNHDAMWPSGRVATGFDEALVDGDGAEAFWANLGQYDDPPGVGEPSRHMVRQSLELALRARPGTPPGLQPLWQAPAQAQNLIQAIIAVDDPALRGETDDSAATNQKVVDRLLSELLANQNQQQQE